MAIPDLSQFKNSKEIVDLGDLVAKRKKEEIFGYDITSLQPTEITELKELAVWAQRKLADHYLTVKSLNQYAIEVDHKFAEHGWSIFVDPFNVELDRNENPVIAPIFHLTGRLEDEEFDYEQASRDTQAGLLDGTVGRVNEKGTWLDPKTVI